MTEEEKAIEANALAIAQEEQAKKEAEENQSKDDAEAKIAQLEAEKAAITERELNYKVAYLKEKKKNEDNDYEGESDEDRIRRITREELAEREVTRIDSEKEDLLKKLARENKELRLATQNKTTNISTGAGGSTEQPIVRSTVITPEQLDALKARGFNEKDIERYKKNLQRYGN